MRLRPHAKTHKCPAIALKQIAAGAIGQCLKSYSSEKGPPWVHGREDLEVVGVSDEHGKLKVGPKADRLRLGDKLMLIPGHCDPTVNLHDWYVAVRAERVEALWPITARDASN